MKEFSLKKRSRCLSSSSRIEERADSERTTWQSDGCNRSKAQIVIRRQSRRANAKGRKLITTEVPRLSRNGCSRSGRVRVNMVTSSLRILVCWILSVSMMFSEDKESSPTSRRVVNHLSSGRRERNVFTLLMTSLLHPTLRLQVTSVASRGYFFFSFDMVLCAVVPHVISYVEVESGRYTFFFNTSVFIDLVNVFSWKGACPTRISFFWHHIRDTLGTYSTSDDRIGEHPSSFSWLQLSMWHVLVLMIIRNSVTFFVSRTDERECQYKAKLSVTLSLPLSTTKKHCDRRTWIQRQCCTDPD